MNDVPLKKSRDSLIELSTWLDKNSSPILMSGLVLFKRL